MIVGESFSYIYYMSLEKISFISNLLTILFTEILRHEDNKHHWENVVSSLVKTQFNSSQHGLKTNLSEIYFVKARKKLWANICIDEDNHD